MNDIDTLMQRIDEINAKPATELAAGDVDDIIAFHRRYRAKKYAPPQPQDLGTALDDLRTKLLGSVEPPPKQKSGFVRRA